MSLWDDPTQNDGDIRELAERDYFELVGVRVRDVKTKYGPTKAVDLFVMEDGSKKVYGGFSAGIVMQAERSDAADFPCFARIVDVDLGEGKTTTQLSHVSVGDTVAS
jgi:hypothetical protein